MSPAVSTLVELLWRRAARQRDENAFTFLADGESEGRRVSWGELDASARRLAAEFDATGLKGERALLLYPAGLEFVEAFLGCLYAGVIAVPAYPPGSERTLPRLRAIARDAAPAAVLTSVDALVRLRSAASQVPELASAAWLTTDEPSTTAADYRPPRLTGDHVAFLQYTSGSTFLPKGVVVSHGNLVHNEEMIHLAFDTSGDSVILGWLPLFHDMGLIGNVLQPLYVGARCVLMPPMAFLRRPLRWLAAIDRYRASVSGGPNFAYELCCRRTTPEQRAALDLSSWRVAFNGAEPVRASTLERFAAAFAASGFRAEAAYPCYGLAEATLFVSGAGAGAGPRLAFFDAGELARDRVVSARHGEAGARLVGCGKPWMGQEVAVVDPRRRRRCAPGRVGEIWVAGPSVAQGYWRKDEESRRDLQARLADEPEAGPFLRTGDLGFIAEGQLFVSGRLKDLIIIRGRNHYPQDLEQTAEEAHPLLRPGSSAAFSVEVDGEEQLVVIVEVERRADRARAAEAGDAVRQAVADGHELRTHEVVLIKSWTLPKTSSGKVQRHLARRLYLDGRLDVVERVARPVGPLPEREGVSRSLASPDPKARRRRLVDLLCREGARAVGSERIAAGTSLMANGLDSLAAVELEQRLQGEWELPLSVTDLLSGRSPEQLADQVAARWEADGGEPATSVATADVDVSGRLSYGQKAMWFLHRLAPESGAYHIVAAARARPTPDADALRAALAALAGRHPMLCTVFPEVEGEPRRRHDPALLPDFTLEETPVSAELDERLRREAYRPFDLGRGPLVRLRLYRHSSAEATLLLVIHHILADFSSLAILHRELAALYAEATGEPAAALPPLSWSWDDYVRWQDKALADSEEDRLWSYWRETLTPLPAPLELWNDRPRSRAPSQRGGVVGRRLAAPHRQSLRRLARERETTLFVVLLASFQVLLERHTARTDFLVGTPSLGRDRAELGGVVGYLVNPLPLRADLSGAPSFAALVDRVRARVLAAFEHRAYPFALLAERLQPERDAGRSPLFQVMLALQQAPPGDDPELAAFALGRSGARLGFAGIELESLPWREPFSPFDLVLRLAEVGPGLELSLQYDAELYDVQTIERFLRQFQRLLTGAAADPGRRVGELPFLSTAEEAQMFTEWNVTTHPPASEKLVHELFAERAASAPDALAVAADSMMLSYGELGARSQRLGRCVAGLGVAPESRIGVMLERSPELLIAYLGVIQAGAAYVPLDPGHPDDRLAFMIGDAGVALVVTSRKLRARLAGTTAAVLELDGVSVALAPGSPPPTVPTAREANLAYVIYTSGSTGRPKGVAVEHRGLRNLVAWHMRTYRAAKAGVTAADRVALTAGLGFDAVVWEVWPQLAAGRSLHLPPEGARISTVELARWLADHEITSCFLATPSAEALLVESDIEDLNRLPLRTLLTGGDRLRMRPVPGAKLRLVNHYGPAESTVVATAGVVASGGGLPSIGGPIANTRLHVLDHGLRGVPVGAPGELCLAGDSLARGYLGRPARSAERFVPDPYSPELGGRLYRTGDLGRWHPRGDVEFLGRRDHQVQVRGQRVELGEIEAALSAHPRVETAVASLRTDLPGGAGLVVHVVPAGASAPAEDELTSFLRAQLPGYMVPARILFLKELPLTPNGKIDRATISGASLPSVEGRGGPHGAFEEVLAELFGELLGVERVGPDESFFALGGHSLLAARLQSRIYATFGVKLPIREVFEAPTVRLLGARLAACHTDPRVLPGMVAGCRGDVAPASYPQEAMWLQHHVEPDSPAYNLPAAVEMDGPLDVEALACSLDEVLRRHDVLRTSFARRSGRLFQNVRAPVSGLLRQVDLRRLPARLRRWETSRSSRAEARRAFDLARDPLVRAMLLVLGAEEHVLVFNLHHVIADGWSMGVLMRELSELYSAFSARRPSPLAEPTFQYADFARWQRQYLDDKRLVKELVYWSGRLGAESSSGAPPPLELPSDRPRPTVASSAGRSSPIALPADLVAELKATGRSNSATLYMTLLATLGAMLQRTSGQSDLAVGSPIAGRRLLETEGLIGCFVDTLVMRVDLRGDPPFSELLGRVRDVTLEAHAHQDMPFCKLVEALQPDRNSSRSPIFQALLVLQNTPPERLELGDLRLDTRALDTGTAKVHLVLSLAETDTGLTGSLGGRSDLFDTTTLRRLARSFEVLLRGAAAEPERRLGELVLMAEVELHQLLVEWGRSSSSPGPVETSAELFEERAERAPDAVALRFLDASLTYAELDGKANRLARYLRQRGIVPGERVALCLEMSLELVVAVVAVLKSGGAYVPLDPGDPPPRIGLILQDSAPRLLLLGSPALAARVARAAGDTELVVLKNVAAWVDRYDKTRPEVVRRPRDLAYVIYTSGSTGLPKGVMVEHRSVTGYLRWVDVELLGAGLKSLPMVSRITFDMSLKQFLAALVRGTTVRILPEEAVSRPSALLEAISGEAGFNCVPSLWEALVTTMESEPDKIPVSLRTLVTGGEELTAAHVERTRRLLPELTIVNLYGPTESTANASGARVDGSVRPSLGRPLAGLSIRVVDRRLRPVPMGVAGELCISGPGLARGYSGRSGATALAFVPDAGGEEAGKRLYRTGDRGRWRPQGQLEFLGRLDQQLKIRGFRIEPGEVEAALAAHPAVREAVVLPGRSASGQPELVAHVVLRDGDGVTENELRRFSGQRLPGYMLPARIATHGELPRTATGKLDRRELTARSEEPLSLDAEPAPEALPRTPVQKVLAGMVADVLGRDQIGIHDNFFELGGQSLLAAELNAMVQDAFEIQIPMFQVLFDAPTVETMAAFLLEHPEHRRKVEAMAPLLLELAEEEAQHLQKE